MALTKKQAIMAARHALMDVPNSGQIFSDPTLGAYCDEVVVEISRQCPDPQVNELSITNETCDVDISSLTNLAEILDVEYPTGDIPITLRNFKLRGDILTITLDSAPEDGSKANIYWGKIHEVLDESTTMPTRLDDILIKGIVAQALLGESTRVANRVNYGENAMVEYMRMGQQKLLLYRDGLNRIRPVQWKQIYSSA